MKNISHRRRGFAMVIAIVMIAMVAVTLSVMGTAMVGDLRRTTMLAEDAQLREMLLAGATIARTRLNSNAVADGPVELPADLKARGADLKMTSQGNSAHEKIVVVEAGFAKHRMSQAVHFLHAAGRWKMSDVSLGE